MVEKAVDPADEKLGPIDALINKQSGEMKYAVLEFGSFLGMEADRYSIPWSVFKYDAKQDEYILPFARSTSQSSANTRTTR